MKYSWKRSFHSSKPEIEKKLYHWSHFLFYLDISIDCRDRNLIRQKIMNESTTYNYFSRRILFVIHCLELEVNQWKRMTKKKEIIKIIFIFHEDILGTRNHIRINEKEKVSKRKRYPNYNSLKMNERKWLSSKLR